MPTEERRRRPALVLLACLFVPATLFLLRAQIHQHVDPQNHALKNPGSRDRANLDRLTEIEAGDATVLLGFTVPGDLTILPADRTTLQDLRRRLAAEPGVVDTVEPPVSEGGLALLAVSLRGGDLSALARRVVASAREGSPPSLRVLATGLPLIEGRIAELVAAERVHIVPWLVGVLLLTATALYRSLALGAAALLPALAGIAWTGGIVALLGHQLDPVGALLDPVLLTIGVASSIHFVEAYRHRRRHGHAPHEAAAEAARAQLQPAFLAMATTLVGLLSLCTSSIPAVIDFGVRASLGVAIVHVFNFLLLPVWLPMTSRRTVAHHTARPFAPAWLAALHRWRTTLLAGTAAVTALAMAALPRLHTDNNPLSLLPADDVVRVDHDLLTSRLGGVEVCHLLVPERSPGCDPSRLLPFLAAVHTLPGAAGLAGPAVRGEEGDLAVPLLLTPAGSSVRSPLFDEIDRAARVMGLDGLVAAGPPVQIARDSVALLQSLFGSFWLTLAVLFCGAAAGLRSWRLGALSMIPNLIPCTLVYGAIAWLDRPVSVATAMIASTMLGLIVDNSLHLLHDYRLQRLDHEPRAAATRALEHCGRGMWLSNGLLALGFLVTSTSRLATTVEFSLLATSTILAGAFVAIVVLPLLLGASDRPAPRNGHAM